MQLRLWLPLSRDMVRILRIVCAIRFCHPMALIVTMQLDATRAVGFDGQQIGGDVDRHRNVARIDTRVGAWLWAGLSTA